MQEKEKTCKICGGTGKVKVIYSKRRGLIVEEEKNCECQKEKKQDEKK
jgi:hypothetical protein